MILLQKSTQGQFHCLGNFGEKGQMKKSSLSLKKVWTIPEKRMRSVGVSDKYFITVGPVVLALFNRLIVLTSVLSTTRSFVRFAVYSRISWRKSCMLCLSVFFAAGVSSK